LNFLSFYFSTISTDLSLSAGLFWAGMMLAAVATFAIVGRRQCKKIAGFLQKSGEWLLWGRNRHLRSNQHEGHDLGHHLRLIK
jgi:hypothetical protein